MDLSTKHLTHDAVLFIRNSAWNPYEPINQQNENHMQESVRAADNTIDKFGDANNVRINLMGLDRALILYGDKWGFE